MLRLRKLCNDVLTRVRQPGPPAAPGWQVPKTYTVGDTIKVGSGVPYKIRHFVVEDRDGVLGGVH
ncbi:MAG: hypothetical protein KGR26_11405, partial [Cyanobacteria bacterium REEB65]|nr:hypothetical protein [Cyanobacteria bacterium REEB65]